MNMHGLPPVGAQYRPLTGHVHIQSLDFPSRRVRDDRTGVSPGARCRGAMHTNPAFRAYQFRVHDRIVNPGTADRGETRRATDFVRPKPAGPEVGTGPVGPGSGPRFHRASRSLDHPDEPPCPIRWLAQRGLTPAVAALAQRASQIMATAFSAIISVGACVLPPGMV